MEEELPILGEPLAIELANTDYGQDDWAIDFLGDEHTAALWLRSSPLAVHPMPIRRATLRSLQKLRDAIRGLLIACVDNRRPPAEVLDTVNRSARRGRSCDQVHWSNELTIDALVSGSPADVVHRTLADATLDLVGGSDRARVRRCAAPDCTMLFVKRHHRRDFCHSSCSQRSRQARYYRRKRQAERDA